MPVVVSNTDMDWVFRFHGTATQLRCMVKWAALSNHASQAKRLRTMQAGLPFLGFIG